MSSGEVYDVPVSDAGIANKSCVRLFFLHHGGRCCNGERTSVAVKSTIKSLHSLPCFCCVGKVL